MKTEMPRNKKTALILSAIAATLILAVSIRISLIVPISDRIFASATRPLNIAHRGGMALWPENTLYAFERALDAGANVLELDVWPTADGKVAVIHDETVDRTTDGSGQVNELTLAELKKLDNAYNFIPAGENKPILRGKGKKIPSLGELFRRLPNAYFAIEIKPDSPEFAHTVTELVKDSGMAARVVLSSFHTRVVKSLQKRYPRINTAASESEVVFTYILGKIGLGWMHQPMANVYQVPVTHGNLDVVTPSFVNAAHSAGQEIYVWTVDNPSEMKRLIEMGVDGIITDRPDLLSRVIDGGKN